MALLLALSVSASLTRGKPGLELPPWSVTTSATPLAPWRDSGLEGEAILERLRAEQEASVLRTLAVLDARFDGYRDRSGAFAEDLIRWSTRGRLAWRSMTDLVGAGENGRRELVRERFQSLVVDEDELRACAFEAVERMALELRADRARALARVRTRIAIEAADAPDGERLTEEVAQLGAQLDRALLQQADRSLVIAVAGVIGATVVTEIVAVAVGSAMTGAAVGAAGGSIIPGAGTVVGFATGLTAGVAVDWWLSEELERDLKQRSLETIDALRERVIEGDLESGTRGLRAILEHMADEEAQALEAPLRRWTEKRP